MYNTYSLSAWLKYLENLDKKNTFNLNELKIVAKKINVLNLKSFVFTVTGTNGKGTTCAMLEKLFLNAGYQVGLYTSPHLFSYVERIKINGCFLNESDHIAALSIVEFYRGSILLSYFEFITLAALILFKQQLLDIVILEVGIGGRLDATNIIDADISVITNIGIDHSFFLGSDRFSIAREKSGIFRKNKIAIIGEKDIPISLDQAAKEKKAILKKINIDWFFKNNKYSWDFIHPHIILNNLKMTQIPLSNAAIALAAVYYSGFNIDEEIIRSTIYKVYLHGRLQQISLFPRIIVDVAHNVDSVLYLSRKLKKLNIKNQVYAIFGVLKDKDIKSMISKLKNQISYWYAAPLKTSRTATKDQLKNCLPIHNSIILNSINESWSIMRKIVKKEDLILVFGSFLTVAEFIDIQKKMKNINSNN